MKAKKAANRELKALLRGSKSTMQSKPSDPDEYQWQIYEKDKKKREDEAATTYVHSNEDQHQWKVCVYPQNKKDKAETSGEENQQNQNTLAVFCPSKKTIGKEGTTTVALQKDTPVFDAEKP